MLSLIQRLTRELDGRYATDYELELLLQYCQSYPQRVETYQKLQSLEPVLIQQTQAKLRSLNPDLLRTGGEDMAAKWKRDTIRVLRYSALAVLLGDPDSLRERLLFWMQTVMKAFGAQRSCNATYEVMQEVAKQHLSSSQAELVCPMLEVNRRILGTL